MVLVTLFSFFAAASGSAASGEYLTELDTKIDFDISCSSVILYNLEYGKVLFSKNADERIYPAALAKLMTALLAFEYWENSDRLVADVTVSDIAVKRATGTKMNFKSGEVVPFEELLYALAVGGANDAACAVAERISGTVDAFAERMTERAKELGCTDTYFDNPMGIHSTLMYTTLRDMLRITVELYKHDDFIRMASLASYTLPATNKSAERKITNRNYVVNPSTQLGYYIPGVMGMCTGNTPEAGYCGADALEYAGLTNIVIVSGGTVTGSRTNHFIDIKKLLNFAKNSFGQYTVLEKGHIVSELPVRLGKEQDYTLLVTENAVELLLPKGYAADDVKTEPVVSVKGADAPVRIGDVFGYVNIYYKGKLAAEVKVVSQTNITRSVYLYAVSSIQELLTSDGAQFFLKIALIVVIISMIFLVIVLVIQTFRRDRQVRENAYRDKVSYDAAMKLRVERDKERAKETRKKVFTSIGDFFHGIGGIISRTEKVIEEKQIEKNRKKLEKTASENKRKNGAKSAASQTAAKKPAEKKPTVQKQGGDRNTESRDPTKTPFDTTLVRSYTYETEDEKPRKKKQVFFDE